MNSNSNNNSGSSSTALPPSQRNSVSSAAAECVTTTSTTADPRFSCNICFEDVTDPVVTQCGHLYCWECLFRWIEPGLTAVERQTLQLVPAVGLGLAAEDLSHRVCPVCKSPCSVTSIIPLYVRNTNEQQQSSATTSTRRDTNPEPIDESIVNAVLDPPPSESHEQDDNLASTDNNNLELRQRLRFRSTDSHPTTVTTSTSTTTNTATTTDEVLEVPARPVPRRRRRSFSEGHLQQQQQTGNMVESTTTTTTTTPNNNNNNNFNRTFAVSQGLALSIHRALGPTRTTTTTTAVPPLHRREGHGSAARAASQAVLDNETADPDATEFLSRILLMLGSFVVLCLLLF